MVGKGGRRDQGESVKCNNILPLVVVSFAAVVWARHANALPFVGEGARCVTSPNNGCEGDYGAAGAKLIVSVPAD